MNFMFIAVDGNTQVMYSPSSRAEHEWLKTLYARDHGYTVINEVDTSDDPRLEPMMTTIMGKRQRRVRK